AIKLILLFHEPFHDVVVAILLDPLLGELGKILLIVLEGARLPVVLVGETKPAENHHGREFRGRKALAPITIGEALEDELALRGIDLFFLGIASGRRAVANDQKRSGQEAVAGVL